MNSKNNHFLLYILIEFFLFSIISSKTVVLKFNELYNEINATEESNYPIKNDIFSNDIDVNYFNDLYQYLLYTIIDIGTPSQQMLGIFNPDSIAFTVGNQDNCYKKAQYNYSFTNSKSSNIIKKIEGDDYFPGHYILNDTIKLYTIENNSKKFEEINNFQLRFDEPKKSWGKVDTNDKLFCGDIGFQINKQQESWAKFLKQLNDKKNLIDSYVVTMNYTNNHEGNFYIGQYPHEYDPKNYKESLLVTTNAIPRQSFSLFRILMNDVYIQNITNDIIKLKSNEVFFHLELGLIVCPMEYYNYIMNKFFNKYLNKSICNLKSMTQKLDSYNMIVCENNNNFDIKSFPSLHFYHSDLNISFSLNYNDLFEAKDNKYYFLVVYSTFSSNYWKLGKPFLKKYQITLNLDAKSISFYKNYVVENDDKNINNENNDGKTNNIALIIICIGLSLILVVVSYLFIKNIKNGKKKKRANELNDDDYEYDADEENGKSDNLIKKNPVIN